MPEKTAHRDSFARDNLPAAADWPAISLTLPELQYPPRLNCGVELLDRLVRSEEAHV